jgi:hypothetical protein
MFAPSSNTQDRGDKSGLGSSVVLTMAFILMYLAENVPKGDRTSLIGTQLLLCERGSVSVQPVL